jgi:hypothetical protein
VDSVLISLDAKKAFDSVSHQYTEKLLTNYCLAHYYFFVSGHCNKNSAKIGINGHLSIDIKRGFKQGDALSCTFFVLGMNPLIRNINSF